MRHEVIDRRETPSDTQPAVEPLIEALETSGWTGEAATDIGTRIVQSTDNSLYQLRPAAVLFPRTADDLRIVAKLASDHGVAVAARGGGTGTNGQSLTESVILDTSRHMNRIGAFDPDSETVTVEPGVVLDQLNAFLARHGYFFPPAVSTASRATIGGMVATDASGQGSRHYGKTSDYIVAMDVVLAGGDTFRVEDLTPDEAADACARDDRIGLIHRTVRDEIVPRRELIDSVFPRMNRGLTGYNLRDAVLPDGGMRLAKLLAGSEGTLAWTASLTLKVRRRPKLRALVIVAYDEFRTALADVPRMVEADPLAVEIVDDKILTLAAGTPLWTQLQATIGDIEAQALLFVEFTGDTEREVEEKVAGLTAILERGPRKEIGSRIATEPAAIAAIWDMRRQGVGLLGALEGERRASPFVEDCAVPPERLAAFVDGFRAILDGHGLDYGMFGHADVGCLHVRPTIDMTVDADRRLVREISDAVAALAKENGGLLWGEHGRGVRAEYSPFFFGEELYGVLRRIKAAFDPGNVFNPRKLAVPEGRGETILRIDEVPFRGLADEQISDAYLGDYAKAVACNGNAACHNWDALDAMCPSYKATRDRVQSPKGRAALIREWARLSSTADDPAALRSVEEALFATLETCLSCKACTSQCPVKVDIPSMKSAFLDRYHCERTRSPRDRLVRCMEPATLAMRRLPRLSNAVIGNSFSTAVAKRAVGMVDLPRFSGTTLEAGLRARGIRMLRPGETPQAGSGEKPSLILLPDSFTGAFDTAVFLAAADLLLALGYDVQAAPLRANGKGLQVRGYLEEFGKIRDRRLREIDTLASAGAPIVAVEPVVTLLYRSEYAAGRAAASARPPVSGLDEFLAAHVSEGRALLSPQLTGSYRLLAHCSEKTADPAVARRWASVFSALGQELTPVRTGCCGMAGLFGHEAEHSEMSEALYDMSWAQAVEAEGAEALATGYSCRSQALRFGGRKLRHPVQALAGLLAARPG